MKPAKWDTLLCPSLGTALSHDLSHAGSIDRMRHRVDAFERLHTAMHEVNKSKAAEIVAFAEGLQRDRVRAWLEFSRKGGANEGLAVLKSSMSLGGRGYQPGYFVAYGISRLMHLAMRSIRVDQVSRMNKHLIAGKCCDCRYPLRVAANDSLVSFRSSRACPECGAGWPLVPPLVGSPATASATLNILAQLDALVQCDRPGP